MKGLVRSCLSIKGDALWNALKQKAFQVVMDQDLGD